MTVPSGSINLDVLKGTQASLPPNTSITGSQHPTILGDNKGTGSVSTWATTFNQNDVFDVSVAACSGVTRAFLDIHCIRNN
jgi:hypothetical protein